MRPELRESKEETIKKVRKLYKLLEKWRLKQKSYPLKLEIEKGKGKIQQFQRFKPEGVFLVFFDAKLFYCEMIGLVLDKRSIQEMLNIAYGNESNANS